jgi:transposase
VPMRDYNRDLVWLLPPSLDELIPGDHPVRFVAELVDHLKLSDIEIDWAPALEGGPSYSRRLLLACWVYGFMTRVRSSRKIEVACAENVPFMWLTGMQRPDHTTLSRFYKDNRSSLRSLFKKTIRLAIEMGLVDFAVHAIDGTKMGTVTLESRLGRKKIEALLAKVDEEIAAMERGMADEESGSQGQVGAKLPKELVQKKALQERLRTALAKVGTLEAASKKVAAIQGDEQSEVKGGKALADGEKVPVAQAGEQSEATDSKAIADREKAPAVPGGKQDDGKRDEKGPRVSVADPEAIVLKGRQGYKVGYNGQIGVDKKAGIIVGATVCADPSDVGQLIPVLDEIGESAGRLAEKTVTDGGYHSGDNLENAKGRATEVYIADPQEKRKADAPDKWQYHKDNFVYDASTDTFRCPEGKAVTFSYTTRRSDEGGREVRVYRCRECSGCPAWGKGQCTKDKKGRTLEISGQEETIREHRKKMQTEEARALIKQRCAIVEPVFGIMREQMGITRFLLRGLENVKAEWCLVCAAYNLRRIWKEIQIARQRAAALASQAAA